MASYPYSEKLEKQIAQLQQENKRLNLIIDELKKYNTITITGIGKGIIVKFEFNYVVKEYLKELGGSWNKTLGGWIFSTNKKDEIYNSLKEKFSERYSIVLNCE